MTTDTPSTKILNGPICEQLTTAPVVMPHQIPLNNEREFLRLPKSGKLDEIFSLSRSTWNTLILPCKANGFKPPIKSVSLRKPGTVRGVRLIVVASARAYFDRLLSEAETAQATRDDAPAEVEGAENPPITIRQ